MKKKSPKASLSKRTLIVIHIGTQLVADNNSLEEKPNTRQDVAVPLQSSASCRTQQVSCFA